MSARAFAVAVLAAIAYALLGRAVAGEPPGALWPIDAAALALAGHATRLALFFTASCWWYVLVAFGAGAIALAILRPAWRGRAIFSIATAFAGWIASDALKNIFARPRPPHWFLHQETSYAYASGHAMFAVVVFGLWSYYVATSALPRGPRVALATTLALWACAVIWSRLALGAHWATDLIGGALLGIAVLALGAAVVGLRSRPAPA